MKVAWIAIDAIDETPDLLNSRQHYEESSINELAASIREHGLLQPICVRPTGDRYVLIFGMRRLKAAIRAGLIEVPCSIQVADDERAFLLNAIENLHRQQLSGSERVRAIERLAATSLSGNEISRRTGFNQSTISRWLKIDRRPLLKEALEADQLGIGRAMALVAVPESALPELLQVAGSLPQTSIKERVAEINQSMRYAYPRRSLDSRRLLEALRLLTVVERVVYEDRHILERIHQRAAQILAVTETRTGVAGQRRKGRRLRAP